MTENVRVVVRCRPMNKKEHESNCRVSVAHLYNLFVHGKNSQTNYTELATRVGISRQN